MVINIDVSSSIILIICVSIIIITYIRYKLKWSIYYLYQAL